MGLDLYIKRRQIKEYEENSEELKKIFEEEAKIDKEFIKNYNVEIIDELKDFSIQEIFEVKQMLLEPDEEDPRWEKFFEIFDIYYMYGFFDEKEEKENKYIYDFFNNFNIALDKHKEKFDKHKDFINRERRKFDEEIAYARKNYEMKDFFKKLAVEKGIIKEGDDLYSFTEVPLNKKDLEEFIELFGYETLEEYFDDFDNENILIYGMIWS